MAQLYTDFRDDTVDTIPADWETRNFSSAEPLTGQAIQADAAAVGEKFFRFHDGSGVTSGITGAAYIPADAAAAAVSKEVVARLRVPDADGAGIGVVLNCGGSSDGTGFGYSAQWITSGERIILRKFTNSSVSNLGLTSHGYVVAVGAWIWVRLQRLTDGTLRARLWPDGIEEPATWHVSAVDTAYAEGWSGVTAHLLSNEHNVDVFGFGTEGDVAPVAPLEAPAPEQMQVEPIVQSQAANMPAVTPTHQLEPVVILQDQSASNPAVTQTHQLESLAVLQDQSASHPTVNQTHRLEADPAVQEQSLEVAAGDPQGIVGQLLADRVRVVPELQATVQFLPD